ncbi:MAG: cysteine--tRNA ligase [Verrucomicrobia bacterium]|nr:cysteine--tRNA ligase [Verrucomicrobiota bacterium]MBV9671764.1 cysteine--tRNA ligase [Verrucomicrobiota bacterium]
MSIRFYNTYSRSVEEFIPIEGCRVRIYTCGPTVYSYAHIGNYRAYIFEDLLQRHLEARGFQVTRVMNITDVDDKTIRGSREAGLSLNDFTAKFKKSFFEDLDFLRIQRADQFPEATDPSNIGRMIEMIDELMTKDIAYQADDKSIYFRINRFPQYGRLAHLNLDELRPTSRVQSDEYEKEHIGDFALWKAWDEKDGQVAWDSPWGKGRPGWHLECSAMSTRLLGPEIDIHCGGVDNIFPHHEAEIAQSESATGHHFVRYWLHCAHLLVDGQKMSKSLGNFYTLRDVIEHGYTGREIRYALLRVNYRLPLNFTFDGMAEARQSLLRIDQWLERLQDLAGDATPEPAFPNADTFFVALDDDLNISAALAELYDRIRATNRAMDRVELTPGQAAALLEWWEGVNQILQLHRDIPSATPEVLALLADRAAARSEKNWTRSDELRYEIEKLGWTIKDTKAGQKLSKITANK